MALKTAQSYDAFPQIARIVRESGGCMAYFRKLKTGWRAEVERKGVRKSKMFHTKAEAQLWAAAEETVIVKESRQEYPSKTLADAIDRYVRDVSAGKRGAHAEELRFNALLRDFPALCGKLLHEVTPSDIAEWRDARRKLVSDSSVVREAAAFRNLFNIAADEWGWCGDSPWKKVKLPPKAHARTRRTTPSELRRIVRHMGFVTGRPPKSPQQEVAWAYLVAHHTAMRAGEVRGLKRSTVDLGKRVVTLHTHKTLEREGVRFVPFTRKAARVLAVLDGAAKDAGRDEYFTISDSSMDVLFRRVRDRLLIQELHFHDSRADALTRLSKRMDVMKLAKISGHRDLNQLLEAYYRETAADIAASI